MPTTPSGTRTCRSSKPLARIEPRTTSPTGSGRPATGRSPPGRPRPRRSSQPLARIAPPPPSPTGSGRPATWRSPPAIPAMRLSDNARRSSSALLMPAPRPAARSASLAANTSGASASNASAIACSAASFASRAVVASVTAAARARRAWSITGIAAFLSQQHEVVTVDDLSFVPGAELGGELHSGATEEAGQLCRVIVHQAVRQPEQAGGRPFPYSMEERADRLARQRGGGERRGGQHHRYARARRDAGRLDLADHAARAQSCPAGLADRDPGQVVLAAHLGNGAGAWSGRVAGVQAVHIGQQHQQVGVDEHGDERGYTVVVAEADLLGRDRVVLVD